jgi:energy-coupling factor transporter ATP-binding protein EcfA2
VRADHLGVIFQMFNLVPYLSVTGNVTLPLHFSPARRTKVGKDTEGEARRLLGRLGLTDETLLERRVSDLSVGQQQRVAAARALMGGPDIVIADEPTSALDADARDRFIELLSEEAGRTGAALLFVSHDASLARQFDRAVDLSEINKAGGKHMKALFALAWKSLLNRRASVLLTLLAVALSVALFLGVDKARTGAREGFGHTISGTDLIIGAPDRQCEPAALFGLPDGQCDGGDFLADLSGTGRTR